MLTVQNLHKAFGTQVIFDGISLQVNAGDRYALMGPNGSGKSTLFRLVLGEQEPDEGVVSFPRHLRVGYLPQETAELGDGTVLQESLTRDPGIDGTSLSSERETAEAKKVLMGLGFRITDFDRPVHQLSGGWQMRVAIARLLMQKPDLYLLDEPTNHLDLESLLWFQEYLQEVKGAVLLISHDRAFVNAIVHGIWELRRQKLYRYSGDYDRFVQLRDQEEEQLLAAYKRQQKEIEEMESFIARFRAQASKAPQVQSRIKMLDRIERIEIPPEEKTVKIKFPQPARASVRVLSLKNVCKSYGDLKVYDDLNFELERGEKVVLAGHNGAGKSTLLKILAGVLPFDKGERILGINIQSGYYAQHRVEMLNSDRTVLEEASDTKRMNPDLFVRTVLGTFLFRGDSVFKKVGVLSGGEKSRLALVKLLLDPPNVMLLDEPTTHLDMASVEALVGALQEYEGTLCFISHDLYFINSLANHVVHVDNGTVTTYPGNYDYFQRRQAQKNDESQETPSSEKSRKTYERGSSASSLSHVKSSADDLKRLRMEERARSKARKKINARIRAIEEEIVDLNNQMGSTFIKSDYKRLMELDQNIKALQKELEDKKAELAEK